MQKDNRLTLCDPKLHRNSTCQVKKTHPASHAGCVNNLRRCLSGSGFFVSLQFDLFTYKGIHVGFMNHTHQAGVLRLDDLEMMVG